MSTTANWYRGSISSLTWAHFLRRQINGTANRPDTTPPTVPVRKPEFLPSRETPKLRATWLGHACYYVEYPSGLRVLFDPVFEDRCSPISWLGPKRYTEMPCQIKDIPIIDAVVISHNHYDHLSYPTVKEISARHPNCHFFVPLGNEQWFKSSGIDNVTELDWWEERDIVLSPSQSTGTQVKESAGNGSSSPGDIKGRVGCLPCQHTSNRGVFDRAKTLWASWYIESGGRKVYFAGYVYRQLFASIKLSLLTCGAIAEIPVTEVCQSFPMVLMTTHRNMTFQYALLSSRRANFVDRST